MQELSLELVGGPHDGALLVVLDVCACCGGDVVPGSVFASLDGQRYVVSGDRCYARWQPPAPDPQGGQG